MKICYIIIGDTKTAIKKFDSLEEYLEFRRLLQEKMREKKCLSL